MLKTIMVLALEEVDSVEFRTMGDALAHAEKWGGRIFAAVGTRTENGPARWFRAGVPPTKAMASVIGSGYLGMYGEWSLLVNSRRV